MPSNYLNAEERVVRYVAWTRLRRDEDDNVVGVLPQAFSLRESEEYLSVTWCEYFDGAPDERLRCAIEAIRNSEIDVKPKAQFVVGVVGDIQKVIEGGSKAHLRFIHEPEAGNPAHAAIRHWPRDDVELFDLLAQEAWSSRIDRASADSLPATSCAVSARGSS